AVGSAIGNATGDVVDDVSNAAAEFSLMGIDSSTVYIYKILLGKSKLFTLDKGKKSRPT
ncbi:hypothetical protein Tco_0391473, partial [Tanacetum coccineum]